MYHLLPFFDPMMTTRFFLFAGQRHIAAGRPIGR
jgi:hypothetical protein